MCKDIDYNELEKSIEEILNNPTDTINDYKPEGTE